MSKSSHPPSHRPSHFDAEKCEDAFQPLKEDLIPEKVEKVEVVTVETLPKVVETPPIVVGGVAGHPFAARESFESKLAHGRLMPAEKPAAQIDLRPPQAPHYGEQNHNGFFEGGHPSPGT